MQALMDNADSGQYRIAAVLSNKGDAYGLERAKAAGIPTGSLSHVGFESREAFDTELASLIDDFAPDLVVLAGFMRILSARFVSHYAGRLINIHPSLLPDFPGTQTHQRALDAKTARHGASVHFVTEELDGGPVIARQSIAVKADDTADTLAQRVLLQEHLLYPKVVAWFARGELKMVDGRAVHSSKVLPDTLET